MSHPTPDHDGDDPDDELPGSDEVLAELPSGEEFGAALNAEVRESIFQLADGDAATEEDLDDALLF